MGTKTITIERDAYELLAKEKRGRETLSQVVRRLITERPATTAEELEEAMRPFLGIGAGSKFKLRNGAHRRHATA